MSYNALSHLECQFIFMNDGDSFSIESSFASLLHTGDKIIIDNFGTSSQVIRDYSWIKEDVLNTVIKFSGSYIVEKRVFTTGDTLFIYLRKI